MRRRNQWEMEIGDGGTRNKHGRVAKNDAVGLLK